MLSFLLFIGIALSPIYLFESGGLQVAHGLLITFFILSLATRRVQVPRNGASGKVFWAMALFVAYAFIREIIAVAGGADPSTLLTPVHAAFGLLTLFFIYNYLVTQSSPGHRNLETIGRSIIVAIAIAMIGLLILGYSLTTSNFVERPVGTFNNPNQLGYFSVLSCSIATMLFHMGRLRLATYIILMGTCLFLSVASLSKSAMIATLIPPASFFAHLATRKGAANKIAFVGLFSGTVIAMIAIISVRPIDLTGLMAYERLVSLAQEGDSGLAVRGYFLFFEASFAEQLFGISSLEAIHRNGGAEVHSTFMAPLTYYGIIGGSTFLGIFAIWANISRYRFGWMGAISICMPVILYGIAHNGGRFTLLWVLVATTVALENRCSRGRSAPSLRIQTQLESRGESTRRALHTQRA